MSLFLAFVILALLFFAAAAILAVVSFKLMLRIKCYDSAYIEARGLEKGEFGPEDLAKPWIEDSVPSPFGYRIAVHALKGSAPRVAIFHHGVTWNWIGAIKYMDVFLRDGWTVVALDSRGHGSTRFRDSNGSRKALHPSYGYYEKNDLLAVADWALARFPSEEGFIVHGESLGAASVLQYAPLDARLDAVIADCPFSSTLAELDHRLRRTYVPKFLRPASIALADLLVRRIDGFSLAEASPERAVLETNVPILFVHGRDDDFVPTAMSVSMYESRRSRLPGAMTELHLVDGARHATSHQTDPVAYASAILDFTRRAIEARRGSAKAGIQ